MASTDKNINFNKYQYYLDPFFIATEGIGAIGFSHIISPLTVASLGYLALELVEIRVTGGDGGVGILELPEHWRWKPIKQAPQKTLDEIKEILRRHLSEEEVEEIEDVDSRKELEEITDKIQDPIDVNQIKTIIANILRQDPTISLVEIDLNTHTTKRLNARNKKIIAKYIEKKVQAELFHTVDKKIKRKQKITTEQLHISNKPKIKITILNTEFEK